MTRNTHDRELDHHGTELASHVELDSATATYGSGDDLMTVIDDIDDRVVAASGGSGGTPDLLTGDSAFFKTGIGNWTNSGGTLTADTASGGDAWGGGGTNAYTAKLVTSSTSQYMECAVPGTFETGKYYDTIFAVRVDENVEMSFTLTFGLIGTDDEALQVPSFGADEMNNNGNWAVYVVHWKPTADRTGVKIRLTRGGYSSPSGTITYRIGGAQVIERQPIRGVVGAFILKPRANLASDQPADGLALMIESGAQGVRLSAGSNFNAGLTITSGALLMSYTGNAGIYVDDSGSGGWDDTSDSGDYANGWNWEVGPDYVGMNWSEKDSSTFQIWPEPTNSIEFIDYDSTHRFRASDGTYVTPFSNLHHYLQGTADPSAGGGVAHPMPAMYLRDNSGTTELWLATGTGATAWTKQNSP